eukprot:6202690-Pleurochrysis_carterae.AAC.4
MAINMRFAARKQASLAACKYVDIRLRPGGLLGGDAIVCSRAVLPLIRPSISAKQITRRTGLVAATPTRSHAKSTQVQLALDEFHANRQASTTGKMFMSSGMLWHVTYWADFESCNRPTSLHPGSVIGLAVAPQVL